MSKRTQIATAIAGVALVSASSHLSANTLAAVQSEEAKIVEEAVKSQQRVDSLLEQSQELLIEYR
ncbi:MAG: hypothetical protein AAGJ37_17590, partial [Pseudomonadota bacterium]